MDSEAEINARMYSKARSLGQSPSYLKKGTDIMNKLINVLKQHSGYSIGRLMHSGNMALKSAICEKDFQLYLFINEEEPPFQAVLLRLDGVIKSKAALCDLTVDEIRRSQYSLNVEINGFEFDLFPAGNLTHKAGFLAGEEQQKKTLEKIKQDAEKKNMYNAGLAEVQAEFFKKQSAFVNEMVRLGKFWFQQTVETKVFNDRYFIELVMVHVAVKEDKKNYIKCFQQFLELLKNFDDLVVVFDTKIVGHKVPKEIKEQGPPLVIDPTNPYNNIAKDWKTDSRVAVQTAAKKTLERISKYGLNDPIDILFK